MVYFAEIDESGIVKRVIAVPDDHQSDGEEWCNKLLGGTWKESSRDTRKNIHKKGGTPFRKNHAGIGFKYDTGRDAFIAPTPYPSWILDEDECVYKSPVSHPKDGNDYNWNESKESWDLVIKQV